MAFFCLKNKGRNPLESDLNIYIYMINSVTTKLFILLHIQNFAKASVQHRSGDTATTVGR